MGGLRHGKCNVASLHLLGKKKRTGKFFCLQAAFRALLLPFHGNRARRFSRMPGGLPVGNFFPVGVRENDVFATHGAITCVADVE